MRNDADIDNLFKDKLNHINGLPESVDWNIDKGWSEYQKQFLSGKVPVKKIFFYMSSAAAAFLIMAVSILITRNNTKMITVHNQTTEIEELDLPDGNSVWLNKNSSVEYPSRINKKQTEINISGEAYLEITNLKSQQYIIKAHNAVIVAETTASFNIEAYPDEGNINISVASGAIKIVEGNYKRGLALLVIQGNYCSVHRSQKLVYSAINKNDNYLAWKTGRIIFNNQPIATVKDILNSYYDINIELENDAIAYCLFSGSFEQKPIDVILNKIQSDLNLTILTTGKRIIFSGKGCL